MGSFFTLILVEGHERFKSSPFYTEREVTVQDELPNRSNPIASGGASGAHPPFLGFLFAATLLAVVLVLAAQGLRVAEAPVERTFMTDEAFFSPPFLLKLNRRGFLDVT